jgi:hypothetical protein
VWIPAVEIDRVRIHSAKLGEGPHRDGAQGELRAAPAPSKQGGSEAEREPLQLDPEEGGSEHVPQLMQSNQESEGKNWPDVSHRRKPSF